MDHRDKDWASIMIDEQEESEKDEELGPAHLEKTISKKQHESFLPQKELGVNRKRKDSNTAGHIHGDRGDNDRERVAKFRKDKEKAYEKLEIELESMPESKELEKIKYRNEAENYDPDSEGFSEFSFLSKGRGEVEIKPETEFSNGWRADGSYADGYWREPSAEDLRDIEVEENWAREQARRINQFNDSKPVKSGSQKVRKVI